MFANTLSRVGSGTSFPSPSLNDNMCLTSDTHNQLLARAIAMDDKLTFDTAIDFEPGRSVEIAFRDPVAIIEQWRCRYDRLWKNQSLKPSGGPEVAQS